MNANLAAAAHVVGRKVTEKTKLNYKSKTKLLHGFLLTKEEYRTYALNDEDIRIPLPDDALKEFFGWLSTNAELPKKRLSAKNSSTADEEHTTPENEVNEFMGSQSQLENLDDLVEEDTFAENAITISHSCMAGYKSAVLVPPISE